MSRQSYFLLGLLIIALLSACASKPDSQISPSQSLIADSIHVEKHPTPTPIVTPRQIATPTPTHLSKPTPQPTTNTPTTPTTNTPTAPATPTNIPGSGTGAAPYGRPPAMTAEEI